MSSLVPRPTFQEVDGTPSGQFSTVKVSNGTLTDNGDGTATLTTGGGGGGGSPGGADTNVQYNSAGSFAGSANFAWNNSTQLLSVTGGLDITVSNGLNLTGLYIHQNDTTNNPIALNVHNAGTGIDFNVENTAHDANFSIRSSAGYGAAYGNLYSTAPDFFGISGWDSSAGDTLKWRIGRAGRTEGFSIFTLDGATEAVWVDDTQQTWFWNDVFTENGPIPQLGKMSAMAAGNVTY